MTGYREGRLEVTLLDQLAKLGRAGHVRALTHQDEWIFRRDNERFKTGQRKPPFKLRQGARGNISYPIANGSNVLRCGAATPTNDIEKLVIRNLSQCSGGVGGLFVVPRIAERVRKPRVGVAANVAIRDRREFLEIRAHLMGPEGTVNPNAQRSRVLYRVPERLGGLP